MSESEYWNVKLTVKLLGSFVEIYLVSGILLIIWIGLFSYIFSLDRKVKKLETELKNLPENGGINE